MGLPLRLHLPRVAVTADPIVGRVPLGRCSLILVLLAGASAESHSVQTLPDPCASLNRATNAGPLLHRVRAAATDAARVATFLRQAEPVRTGQGIRTAHGGVDAPALNRQLDSLLGSDASYPLLALVLRPTLPKGPEAPVELSIRTIAAILLAARPRGGQIIDAALLPLAASLSSNGHLTLRTIFPLLTLSQGFATTPYRRRMPLPGASAALCSLRSARVDTGRVAVSMSELRLDAAADLLERLERQGVGWSLDASTGFLQGWPDRKEAASIRERVHIVVDSS